MKRFKSRRKHKLLKLILFIIFIYVFFKITLNILDNEVDPSKYINYLVSEGLNYKVNNVDNILNVSLLLDKNIKSDNKSFISYVDKVNKRFNKSLIYIYNTHDSEEYKLDYSSEYSVIPNVKIASYVLQEYLKNNNIESYVELNSIKKILDDNNWIYKDSYKASRILLEKNNTYEYYIDIHRDSSSYDKTTLNSDKVYAKIMFIVGLENESYEYNLKLSSELSDMLNKKVNGISKGVLKKEGLGVNGVYNQDFSHNLIVIEIGGVDNNILEVSNSIKVLADVLSDYIGDDDI
jgi:stage II sporulation protein P